MTKDSAAEELLTAIREVSRGKSYFCRNIAGRIKARRQRSHEAGVSFDLTKREKQVVALIAQGQPNKQAARTLDLSIKTIEKHRQAAMDKLQIHDVAGLTRYAMAHGLVPATTPTQQVLPFGTTLL